jgi:hypothetical protein
MKRLVCAIALWATGCGPSSYADFRDQFVGLFCRRQVRCGAIGATEMPSCGVPDELMQIPGGALDVNASVNGKRMRFNSTSAQECLDALAGAPCDPAMLALRLERHCHDVVSPAVSPGGVCFGAGECRGGVCKPGGGGGCPGTCINFPFVGTPCAPGDCDPSVEFCGSAKPGDPLTCLLHKQEGDRCAANQECSFGLVCGSDGKCGNLPRTPRGQPCGGSAPLCEDGLFCSAVSGTCAPLQSSGQPCEPNGCVAGDFCFGGQACKPWLDAGQACVDGFGGCPGSQNCRAGVCAPNSLPPLPVGLRRACAMGVPCALGFVCSARSICDFPVGLGGRCAGDADCGGPLCQCPATMPDCNPGLQVCAASGVTCDL